MELNHIETEFSDDDIILIGLASQETWLHRNKTGNRLLNNVSKRDIESSDKNLIKADKKGRLISNDGEMPFANYVKIDNSNLSPDVVAKMLKNKLLL